jgi:branched-chain amino acid aminotransferase
VHNTASVDGVVTRLEDGRIPVLDRGFLYGDSVYEVFRTYEGVPFLYDEHWRRLQNSASLIYMQLPMSSEELLEQVQEAVDFSGAAADKTDVYVRYAVTRGQGAIDLHPAADAANRLVIIVKALDAWNPDYYSTGVSLAVPSVRRNPETALSPNIKGGNYLNNVMGVVEARQRGADDCLLLNEAGLVTEASNSNVFFGIGGTLVTPSQEASNLQGLTKQTVHEVCRRAELACEEQAVDLEMLAQADECFLTSATREVMAVRSIRLENGETKTFPAGGGALTQQVAALYSAYVANYVNQNRQRALF